MWYLHISSISQTKPCSRQRQTLADEDAPPMSSINDIPNEINVDPSPGHFQPRVSRIKAEKQPVLTLLKKTTTDFSSSRRQMPTGSSMSQQTVYVIVFGYPPDKYSVTVEYFKSLGNSTDADPHTEIANCFKIGYSDAGDAMRAVRKNGEILGGSFMVGAKWADPSQAEGLLGQPVHRTTFSSSVSPSQNHIESPSHSPFGNSMAVDEPYSSNTPTVGTPIKLVPSASAFRKINAGGLPSSKPATPQPKWGSNAQAPAGSASGLSNGNTGTPGVQPSPSKGMIGQVSDLIFGW